MVVGSAGIPSILLYSISGSRLLTSISGNVAVDILANAYYLQSANLSHSTNPLLMLSQHYFLPVLP